jgi:hypothetical protein
MGHVANDHYRQLALANLVAEMAMPAEQLRLAREWMATGRMPTDAESADACAELEQRILGILCAMAPILAQVPVRMVYGADDD